MKIRLSSTTLDFKKNLCGTFVALIEGTPHGGQVPPPKPGRFFFL